jgi:hypothetical protein
MGKQNYDILLESATLNLSRLCQKQAMLRKRETEVCHSPTDVALKIVSVHEALGLLFNEADVSDHHSSAATTESVSDKYAAILELNVQDWTLFTQMVLKGLSGLPTASCQSLKLPLIGKKGGAPAKGVFPPLSIFPSMRRSAA